MQGNERQKGPFYRGDLGTHFVASRSSTIHQGQVNQNSSSLNLQVIEYFAMPAAVVGEPQPLRRLTAHRLQDFKITLAILAL